MSELHSVFIQVNILQVKLHIRFPCKLAFQLQSQTSSAHSKLQYEIRNGQCQVGEELQSKEVVSFNEKSKQYGDHQMKLLIEMKSNSGIIPAGHATLNLSKLKPLQRNVCTLPLDKCPDKNATITFQVELEFIQKLKKEEKINEFHFDSRSHVESLHEMANSHIIEITSDLATREKTPKKYPSQVSNYSRNAAQKKGSVLTNNHQEFAQSHVKTYGYENRNIHTFSKNMFSPQSYAKASLYHGDQLEELRSVRYIDMQEKSNFLKEIGKLKGQLRSLQVEDKLGQNAKLKQENRVITLELDNVRERLKRCERKQRETTLSLKDVKEQLQRARARINQVEITKKDIQTQLEKKQKNCKEILLQSKRLNDKIEEVASKLSALQKKSEYKETSMQEQMRVLNEKYTNAESERKKQAYELHSTLSKLEESERRGQANMKERQRSYLEEKGKMVKNNDALSQQIAKCKQIIQQKQLQNQVNIATIATLSQREAHFQSTIQALQAKERATALKLKQQEELKIVREKEIQNYKVIETQRNNFRRKNQELSQANSQLSEKLGNVTSEKERCQLKIKELEISLENSTRETQEWLIKYHKQAKQLQNCMKNQAKLAKEAQFLSNESQLNLKKYNQLKTKNDSLEKQAEQTIAKNQERINYLSKIREYRDNEIEELKATISKHMIENQQLNARLKAANDNIFELNQQIINLQKNNRLLMQEDSERKNQLEQIRQRNEEYAKRSSLLNQTLKKNSQSLFEQQKQIKIHESQIAILAQSHKVQISKYQERLQQKEQIIRQKEKQLSQRIQEIPNLSYQIKSGEESISIKDHLLIQRNQQIEALSSQINSLKLQLENKQKQNKQLYCQIQEMSQKIAILEQQMEKASISLEQANQKYTRTKEQWSSYHTNTKNALEKILEEIAREDSSPAKYNLQNFPDETLSIMQVQLIKKKNQAAMAYNAKILSLNEQKQMAEMQLVELKKRTAQRQEELQRLLITNRENSKASLTVLEKQKEELTYKIQQRDTSILELKSEVEKKNNQLSKTRSDIEELTQELYQVKQQRQLQSNEIMELQREIMSLKSQQISHKHNPQGNNNAYVGKVIEISKLKNIIQDQQKQINDLILKNEANDKIIKRQENQLQELVTQADNKKLQLENMSHILHRNIEQKNILEKKYSTLQQENKQLKIVIKQQKERLIMQRAKIEQFESMRTQTYNSLTEGLVQNEKLKANIASFEAINKQSHIKIKQLQSKHFLTIDNFTKEVNRLKEKCIELASANELKGFQILQYQASSTVLKEELEHLKQDYEKRRNEAIDLHDQIENMRNQNLYTSQTIDILTSEKKYLQDQAQNLKQKVSAYELELEMAQEQIEKMELKYKQSLLQIQKLKNQLSQHQRNEEQHILPIKGSISTTNFRNNSLVFSKVGQDKKRIRQLQRLLENKHIDIALQRKKLLRELQREKKEYLNEINYLASQVNSLQHEYAAQHNTVLIKVIQEKEYIETKEQE